MTDPITSTSNPTLKRVKRLLGSSKFRREQVLAVAEGVHLTESFLNSGRTPSVCLYAESAMANPEIKGLLERLEQLNAVIVPVKDSLFEATFDVHAGVGIVIEFALPRHELDGAIVGDCLLLEDIQDPGNIGTILRTAAAAGVTNVYLSPDCSSAWSPKALRAGMGAQFSLVVHEGVDLIAAARAAKIPLCVTSLDESRDIYSVDLVPAVGWIFGNEGQGVSAELAALANQRVIIPQAATAVESLNVSAAVAVCLFEQRRQRTVR